LRVHVALECRFQRLPDGSVWTQGQFDAAFWRRYLDVFDHVSCIARVQKVIRPSSGWLRADGPGVTFSDIPYYVGPAQYVVNLARVRRAIREAIRPGDAFVLRVPGALGNLVAKELEPVAYPYAVEVVSDPYDVFAPGAVRHPLRPLFRWHMTRQLRSQCARASAACYVTTQALQQRYPSSAPSFAASTIELHEETFAPHPRRFAADCAPRNLVFVGSLEQYYKAPDVVIRAVARNVARGIDLRLTMIGDGRVRPALEALVVETGCVDRIRFAGQLPGSHSVRIELDRADLFVLPSRTEGLPRAMLEAMARGLPCIGSSIGGIPELLPEEALVPPGDVSALAAKIHDVVCDPARMERMSAVNLNVARDFRHATLQRRRVSFYQLLRATTEGWLYARRKIATA
jgi:glycosyltransferase involved in cell wall biosynthesis